ncbi:hypothetical protein PIB30_073951, partial [Stylosanthes scabra]|nr:hypothetical protein [Stylosanthes scabra]
MVPFTLVVIDDILEIPRFNIRGKDDLQKALAQHEWKEFDMAQVLTVIGRDEGNWSDEPDVKGIPPRLKQKKLNVEARLWHQIIVTYLDPAQHDTTLSHSTAIMIWALMEEKKINLPRVLKDAMHK